jgi:hypothetical protein
MDAKTVWESNPGDAQVADKGVNLHKDRERERYEDRRSIASSRDITSGSEGRSLSFFSARFAALSRCFSTRAISFCRFLKVVRDPTAMSLLLHPFYTVRPQIRSKERGGNRAPLR